MHWLTKKKVQDRMGWLRNLSSRTVGPVQVDWFTTPEYLPFETAWNGNYQPFQIGAQWGAGGPSEKAYFKLKFTVPAEAQGQRTMLRVKSGGEGLCYRPDGSPWQGMDWIRNDLLLSESAAGGEQYELLLEVIPSKSYWAAFDGPVKFEQASVAIEQPTLAQAAFLAETCYDLAQALEQEKLRTERLWQALDAALEPFPWGSENWADYLPQAEKAIAILTAQLKLRGEEGRLTLEIMPHSHIDTGWLWPFSETVRKCGRTFSTTLNYMAKYPHYRFIQSQPALYKFVQQNYPTVYAGIKDRVAEGRWEPIGAMWVEPDTNVPSGESLVRQILLGNGYFEREFGMRSRVLWLPDVFGYSGALPQILSRAGVDYFVTNKLHINEDNKFPYEWFHWEGIDGTKIIANSQRFGYGEGCNPHSLLNSERVMPIKELDFSPYLFGYGDGGGGPTEADIQAMPYLQDTAGLPRTRIRPVEETFAEAEGAKLPVWRGELYFEMHRGTYTSQAMTKRLNRECELSLRDAEMLAAWEMLSGGSADAATFAPLWETLCLNQFHDILPGSSRPMVYAEIVPMLAGVRDKARQLASASFERLTQPAPGQLAIANTLSWGRTGLVKLPDDYAGEVVSQQTAEGKLGLVNAPGMGLFAAQSAQAAGLQADGLTLANQWVKATFNAQGQLVSLYDLTRNREALATGEVGNELRLHEDRPSPNLYGGGNDAWDISVFYANKYVTLTAEKAELIESGPVRATLRFTYRWERGEIVQEATLYAHAKRLEFRTHVNWNEDQRMLRAYFPLSVNNDFATYEIQFGHLRRPNHRNTSWDATKFEVCGHKWADLSEGDFGLALLNNCKYGYAALENMLSITLLRATISPDPNADRGEHDFTYAALPHGLGLAEVVKEAYELNVPLMVAPNRAPKQVILLGLSADHVLLETMKPAENGNGVIVRCYEALNSRGPVQLTLPNVTSLVETNLVEQDEQTLSQPQFEIKPFEIKTFRIR